MSSTEDVQIARELRSGVELIAAERQRQIDQEGYTPEDDVRHAGESLALAACCYALPPQMRKWRRTGVGPIPTLWPWYPGYWKPTPDDRVRELVKAGALIAAEIDRLQAEELEATPTTGNDGLRLARLAARLRSTVAAALAGPHAADEEG